MYRIIIIPLMAATRLVFYIVLKIKKTNNRNKKCNFYVRSNFWPIWLWNSLQPFFYNLHFPSLYKKILLNIFTNRLRSEKYQFHFGISMVNNNNTWKWKSKYVRYSVRYLQFLFLCINDHVIEQSFSVQCYSFDNIRVLWYMYTLKLTL